MAALEAIVLPAIGPADLLGLQDYFLDAVRSGDRPPMLIVYRLAERLLSIGRFHLWDGPDERDGIRCYRRFTGGRVYGTGEGRLGISLILPRRDALLSGERQP